MPAATDTRRDWSVVALLFSLTCSAAAVFLQETVLGKQVFDISGRELDLGLLGLAEFAPAFLLVLVTGSIADRFDRRRVAAAGLVGQMVATAGILHRSLERADRLLPRPRHPIRFGLTPGDRQHRLRLPHADLPAPDGLGQQRAVPEPARESGHLLGGAGGDSQHFAGVVADADVAKPEDAVAAPEDVEVFADGDIEGATAAGDAGQDGVDGFRKEDADGLIPDAGDGPLEHRRGFGQRRQAGVGWIDRRFAHSFWIAGPSDIQVHGPDAFSA